MKLRRPQTAPLAVQEDMPYLHTALASANPELQQACLFPSYQQLAMFAEQHNHLDLSDALELFAERFAPETAAARICCLYDSCSLQ